MRRWLVATALLIGAALSGGCSVLPVPVGPPLARQQVVETLRQRAARFTTVQDTDLKLVIEVMTEKGMRRQPSLGGALAFDSLRPGLWLRAEKLGQKVFSLRAGADYFWLEIPDTREVVTGGRAAFWKLPQLVLPYDVLLWFGSPDWLGVSWDSTAMTVEPECYRFDVVAGRLPLRSVLVDRRQVVVTRILDYDLLGRLSTDVTMDRYEQAGGVLFPRRLTVWRPVAGYRLQLRLGNPKFNRPINPIVFEPLERQGWPHVDLDREPLSSVKAFGGQP